MRTSSIPGRQSQTPLLLSLTRDGRIVNDSQVERIERLLPGASDCFVFCHGWLYDEEEAKREGARFFALLDAAQGAAGVSAAAVRVTLHWPSKPFADRAQDRSSRGPGLLRALAGTRSPGLSRVLVDLCEAEVPVGPEEEAELDGLLRRLRDRPGRGGALPLSPLQLLSFWVMKRRAGQVGERFGREWLAPLARRESVHLVGHSFGGKLLASAVLEGARPQSLTLLLAAFSAFAFAPEVPGYDRPGVYHPVLAEARVSGPIVVLRSQHDRALATLYPFVTGGGQVDRARNPGRTGHTRGVVATSAIGATGARGVGAPEIALGEVPQIGLPRRPIVNVDGSGVVRAQDLFLGAHRDIFHGEVATLVLLAAGLLQGGPGAVRPARAGPLVHA